MVAEAAKLHPDTCCSTLYNITPNSKCSNLSHVSGNRSYQPNSTFQHFIDQTINWLINKIIQIKKEKNELSYKLKIIYLKCKIHTVLPSHRHPSLSYPAVNTVYRHVCHLWPVYRHYMFISAACMYNSSNFISPDLCFLLHVFFSPLVNCCVFQNIDGNLKPDSHVF